MRNGENGLIKSRPLYITTSLVLLVVLIFSLLLAVTFGSVRIPLRDVYGVILYKLAGIGDASVYGSGKIRDVVWIIRLPRLLLSMSVGIGHCHLRCHHAGCRQKPARRALHARHFLRCVPWRYGCNPHGHRNHVRFQLCRCHGLPRCILHLTCRSSASPT